VAPDECRRGQHDGIIVFLILQRHVVRSIAVGPIKG